PRTFDAGTGRWVDGDTLFLSATAWRGVAEHAVASLTKGKRVIATGALKQRSYDDCGGTAHRRRARGRGHRPVLAPHH
ncbi:single-stranded DNA-binding protein, partial [Variovorax sp. 2RAF20]